MILIVIEINTLHQKVHLSSQRFDLLKGIFSGLQYKLAVVCITNKITWHYIKIKGSAV